LGGEGQNDRRENHEILEKHGKRVFTEENEENRERVFRCFGASVGRCGFEISKAALGKIILGAGRGR
jgi:hypothetical protein